MIDGWMIDGRWMDDDDGWIDDGWMDDGQMDDDGWMMDVHCHQRGLAERLKLAVFRGKCFNRNLGDK